MVDAKVATTENAVWFLVKLFVLFGGLFTLMISGVDYVIHGHVGSWWFAGLFFGTGMAVTLGSMHLLRGRRPGVTGALRVNQSGTATIAGPIEKAVAHVRSSLVCISARKIRITQGETPVILARMPITLWSFGETIRIALHELQSGAVEVDVCSQPLIFMTVVDYGKNRDNVDAILERLVAGETKVQGAS